MLVEYSSNNSGGSWWLTDEDWKTLEAAGWTVRWLVDHKDPTGSEYRNGRFLGALAMYATKEFPSVECARTEWEALLNQDADALGCHCCGQPHDFYEKEYPKDSV